MSETLFLFLVLLGFTWLGALSFLVFRVHRTFGRLTKGVNDKDLKEIMEKVLEEAKKREKREIDLAKQIEELKIEGMQSIQKVGTVRYNPFADTGGNQSFVLAFLDGHDSGFVLTSLHSRDSTRIFAKPVKEGKEAGFEFSKEEISAILQAQKNKKSN